MNPKVSIIILNWNGWKDTIECLESLYQITYPNYDVILVDNGSEDESIEKIKEYCGGKIMVESKFFKYDPINKPIKIIEYTREEVEAGGGKENEIDNLPSDKKMILIKNEKNYGFAEGNNIGMRYALRTLNPDYVLLLNNDTVVDKEFLGELVKVAEEDEKIGIVGPRILNPDGTTQFSCWKYHPYLNVFNQEILFNILGNFYKYLCTKRTRKVDVVLGACMLFKRHVIDKIGLFDKNIYMYTEETDICYRIKKNGYRIIYHPKCHIIHYGGQSSKKIPQIALIHSYRSRIYFFHKHFSHLKAVILESFLIIGLYERIILLAVLSALLRKNRYKELKLKLKEVLRWYKKERGGLNISVSLKRNE